MLRNGKLKSVTEISIISLSRKRTVLELIEEKEKWRLGILTWFPWKRLQPVLICGSTHTFRDKSALFSSFFIINSSFFIRFYIWVDIWRFSGLLLPSNGQLMDLNNENWRCCPLSSDFPTSLLLFQYQIFHYEEPAQVLGHWIYLIFLPHHIIIFKDYLLLLCQFHVCKLLKLSHNSISWKWIKKKLFLARESFFLSQNPGSEGTWWSLTSLGWAPLWCHQPL